MPVYDQVLQDEYLSILMGLLTKYGIDVSKIENDINFRVEFIELVIKKDRHEFKRIIQELERKMPLPVVLDVKTTLLSNFSEYDKELEVVENGIS